MPRKPSKPAKKPSSAKKPAPKAKPAKAAKKKAVKPEKKLARKKAAAPAPPAKAKPAKAASPRPTKLPKAAEAAKSSKSKKAKAPGAGGPARKKPAVVPIGIAKPGLGHKWSCFNCGAKFYDLGKPIPVCPKCEADQRDRPPVAAEPAPVAPQPKRPAMAPMSRFLDDDEVAAPEPDEFGVAPVDDAEDTEAAEIDIETLEEPAGIAGEGDFGEADEE